jgi:NAD(P)-dependent dehydrogenase (short-subunit alcohol dehydrogenase family)
MDDLVERFGDLVLPLQLDVSERDAAFRAVGQAHERFGRLDVIVNNAGYGQFGMVEEATEQEARTQMDTNLFGVMWVTQAVLPILRQQGSGHILQISSVGGIIASPGYGVYHASKWALEGLSQALAQEVAQFGIKVTIIEPGGFDTDGNGPSARYTTPMAVYDELREAGRADRAGRARPLGDPLATCAAVLEIVDQDDPPLRVFLGDGPLAMATGDYESRLALWRQWDHLAVAAHGRS